MKGFPAASSFLTFVSAVVCFFYSQARNHYYENGYSDPHPGQYKLIAHRGGITGGEFEEYDPASIKEAIRRGYYMLEIDIRSTKDSMLILNHDNNFNRFFDNPAQVEDLTWEEVKKLRSVKGKFHPPSLEEVARMCSGKIRLMIDIKLRNPEAGFYRKLKDILSRYNLFNTAYFINHIPEEMLDGKGKLYFRVADIPRIKERLSNGENIASRYFLFDSGTRLTEDAIDWSRTNHIAVVPSINYDHYKQHKCEEAKKHIEFLKKKGVIEFQVDSDFAGWLTDTSASAGPIHIPSALHFKNKKFRIAQFTDIHYKYNSPRSDTALMNLSEVVRQEKPDLIVLTGDIVCSANTDLAWRSLAASISKTKVPWVVVLGNHDIEYELSGKEIMNIVTGWPYCLAENGPDSLAGNGNYLISLKSSISGKNEAVLYFLDSHSSLSQEAGYDWIRPDQINWYKQNSRRFKKENKTTIPSLAFFHIPLPEYNDVLYNASTTGIQEESVCSPKFNSGLFGAMKESKDIIGIFCGHDHNSNFIGYKEGIALAYGSVSGIECYGKIGRGARIIELQEGERKFTTWIRYPDSPVKFKVIYPDSFEKQ
ncbi:MAG: metallophosphoesterase [Bacteroidota bacterium]|nr:metallophosphoesterase [Bacteroidota bacterium]